MTVNKSSASSNASHNYCQHVRYSLGPSVAKPPKDVSVGRLTVAQLKCHDIIGNGKPRVFIKVK